MNEIKCPHCGTVFAIDEAEYAGLVQQVRTAEFEKEIHARLTEAEKAKKAEIELAEAKVAQQAQQVAAQKDTEIQRLKNQLEGATNAEALALTKSAEKSQKALGEKDAQIARLKAELEGAANAQQLAVAKAAEDAQTIAIAKNAEIQRLKGELDKASTIQELAVTKAVSVVKEKLSEVENKLVVQAAERQAKETSLKVSHSKEIALLQEQIEQYRDFKAKQSVKLLGESLEQHCETEFNRVRAMAFPNAKFGKDNDASTGTKGDYLFRDFSYGERRVHLDHVRHEERGGHDGDQKEEPRLPRKARQGPPRQGLRVRRSCVDARRGLRVVHRYHRRLARVPEDVRCPPAVLSRHHRSAPQRCPGDYRSEG